VAGSIIQRGDRTWLVRFYVGSVQGKRKYDGRTIHGTKKDAQAYLNAKLRERDLGTYASVRHTLVDTLLDDLLADYKINGKDYAWAELNVRVHLRPFFGAMRASTVGTDQIRTYIAERQDKGAANATINRSLALLRRAFNLGKMATPPKVSVVPFVPMLAENNVRKGFFEHDSFLAIRRLLPEEIRPVTTFAHYTGCQKGEILALQWPQVDLSERCVRLEPGETKNDDARMIPLAPELYEVLKLQREIRDQCYPESPWVFSRAGNQIRNFRKAWDNACERKQLEELCAKHRLLSDGVNAELRERLKAAGVDVPANESANLFHDLRRTGVRNLVRAGVPERVAMMISGHKTRAVFDRYNIVSEADLKDAARRLGEYLAHKGTSSGAPMGTSSAERHTIGTHPADTPIN
jgi:integrase